MKGEFKMAPTALGPQPMSDDKNKITRYSASVPDLIFANPPVFGDVEVVLLSDHEAEVAKYRQKAEEQGRHAVAMFDEAKRAQKAEREAKASQITEAKAQEVLGGFGDREAIRVGTCSYVDFSTKYLSGCFTAEQLKAIAFWMENKGKA